MLSASRDLISLRNQAKGGTLSPPVVLKCSHHRQLTIFLSKALNSTEPLQLVRQQLGLFLHRPWVLSARHLQDSPRRSYCTLRKWNTSHCNMVYYMSHNEVNGLLQTISKNCYGDRNPAQWKGAHDEWRQSSRLLCALGSQCSGYPARTGIFYRHSWSRIGFPAWLSYQMLFRIVMLRGEAQSRW